MLQRNSFPRAIAIILCVLLCFPVVAVETTSATVKPSQRTALDLRMGPNGSIRGKVVNRQGKPISNAEVQLASKRGNHARINAAANGVFTATGMSAGEYNIRIENQPQIIRVWNAETAPPNTAEVGLFVVGTVVRAQCDGTYCNGACTSLAPMSSAPSWQSCGNCDSCHGYGHGKTKCKCLLTCPWMLGAGVAAAIAIPLAVDDDDDAS